MKVAYAIGTSFALLIGAQAVLAQEKPGASAQAGAAAAGDPIDEYCKKHPDRCIRRLQELALQRMSHEDLQKYLMKE